MNPTVDRWDLPPTAMCFWDETGQLKSPGKMGARVIILDALGVDQEGLGQTDFKKTQNHHAEAPVDTRNRKGRRSGAWNRH